MPEQLCSIGDDGIRAELTMGALRGDEDVSGKKGNAWRLS
jgi:hypothetical protein